MTALSIYAIMKATNAIDVASVASAFRAPVKAISASGEANASHATNTLGALMITLPSSQVVHLLQ